MKLEQEINKSTVSERNIIQVTCPGENPQCCYVLSDNELIAIGGIKKFKEFAEKRPVSKSDLCVLCAREDGITKLDSKHSICETCKKKYVAYMNKSGKEVGSRCKCPVNYCQLNFFVSLS